MSITSRRRPTLGRPMRRNRPGGGRFGKFTRSQRCRSCRSRVPTVVTGTGASAWLAKCAYSFARMARNPRYDILFEPVKIGPVTAPNRFYAVPHASGMTNAMPHMRAAFRGTKAEGGWGVVCTGYVSIDPSSDDTPLPFATLWDEDDIRARALMTDAVHSHGARAGVEVWQGIGSVMHRSSRIAPLSPSGTSWMATHVN